MPGSLLGTRYAASRTASCSSARAPSSTTIAGRRASAHAVFVRSPFAHARITGDRHLRGRRRPRACSPSTPPTTSGPAPCRRSPTSTTSARARPWPSTRSATSATRSPWWSPRPAPRPWTPPSSSTSTTTTCRSSPTSRPPGRRRPAAVRGDRLQRRDPAPRQGPLRPVRRRRPRRPGADGQPAHRHRPDRGQRDPRRARPDDGADRLGLDPAPPPGPRPARRGPRPRRRTTSGSSRPTSAAPSAARPASAPTTRAIALAARQLGRPVKWTETRSEAMLSMQGRGQVQYAELGLTAEGRIAGLRLRVLGECGAYAGFGGALAVGPTYLMAQGPYVIPELRFDALGVMTNTAPVGAFRGAGRPEAAACIERLIDVAADELGHRAGGDPAAQPHPARRVPVQDAHRASPTTSATTTCRCGRRCGSPTSTAARAEQQRRHRRRRDAGCSASASRPTSRSPASAARSSARSQVHDDGSATVHVRHLRPRPGPRDAFSMIVADRLGIPLEKITYRQSDTALVRTGGGTGGSRSLQLGGNAVGKAADELREKAVELAARMLEAAPDDVDARRRTAFGVAGVPGQRGRLDRAGGVRPRARGRPRRRHRLHAAGRDVPVRRPRRDRRGRHRDRPGDAAAARRRRRLRTDPQPADRRRPAARRRASRASARRCGRRWCTTTTGTPITATFADYAMPTAADAIMLEASNTETPTPVNPHRRQGHRRVRDHRLDAGRAERRGRRAQPPRRQAHRPALHARAGLARDPRHAALGRVARAAGGVRRG